MSTVSTHLCQYEGEALANKQRAAAQATAAWVDQARARDKITIARVEELLAAHLPPSHIAKALGMRDGVYSLRKVLYRNDRFDLADLFTRRPKRHIGPRCALKDCNRWAVWIEDEGLDPDDEPIAHWGYLCGPCQKFEDMCEDIQFLLDPKRGNETNIHTLCGRVGYEPSTEGLDALRQQLKRHKRFDLRDALDIASVKGQRQWHLQGTFRSSPRARREGDVTSGAALDPVGVLNGLERSLIFVGAL